MVQMYEYLIHKLREKMKPPFLLNSQKLSILERKVLFLNPQTNKMLKKQLLRGTKNVILFYLFGHFITFGEVSLMFYHYYTF